ncbi:LuxR C-terminal-related transcriptional regulator [Janthinobacterium sp. AD80]|uniref:LuxR C-terminal-related transcriptional regulator n=1 Tax=Janthinobacterium sp. AD80 TaxID=1528773 RepID=UPI000C85F6A7|nr:LuxR C-terminal-related transcriptional regulator [Janthinobacterium sp. AD80]PMQ10690.1 HTH-type quorum sensing-dependent transcriptional regulator VjbR [Janthinobacterium sp. AD80]
MMPLTAREQEYVLHAIVGAHGIAARSDFFLWSQGPLQALLPHAVLVCAQLGADGAVLRSEAWHSAVLDAAQVRSYQEQAAHLAPAWRAAGRQARVIDGVLVHANMAAGGGSLFALFSAPAPQADAARQAYLLELLLPYLHLHWLALPDYLHGAPAGAARAASARELEVLRWVSIGKSNEEVGQILGISGWTVKSHLQRIYKLLGVSNRTQAVTRGMALRLIGHQR